ncbi:uncharacterized protein NPIL_580641 [Nephila pilipes]|uniref:Uncharacterized protein n=1 Tax=Nephila pilipes TaxID=299642 RepID=A0A8X6K2U5_NEPPI|nr:uncharacterized protein NPIL_580641 [Nephila pilipes]
MEFIRLSFLIIFVVPFANSNPLEHPQLHQGVPFIVEKNDGKCAVADITKWTSEFHECFIDRKYNDGGENLNSIVDRILDHSEACLEISSKECRPDFQGFRTILNKTITQMKDYANMYLEEIYKGREKINDLDCVETVLTLTTYEKCFNSTFQKSSSSEENFQDSVSESISCTNQANKGCSKEAKTSLNRMVRVLLGVPQPFEEFIEEEIKPTDPPPKSIAQVMCR